MWDRLPTGFRNIGPSQSDLGGAGAKTIAGVMVRIEGRLLAGKEEDELCHRPSGNVGDDYRVDD